MTLKSWYEMTSSCCCCCCCCCCWPLFHKNETDEYSKEGRRWKEKKRRERKRSLGNISIHNLGVTALFSISQFLSTLLLISIHYFSHFLRLGNQSALQSQLISQKLETGLILMTSTIKKIAITCSVYRL